MKTKAQLNAQIEAMAPQQVREFISAVVFARFGALVDGNKWFLDQNAEEHNEMILSIESTIEEFALNPDSL